MANSRCNWTVSPAKLLRIWIAASYAKASGRTARLSAVKKWTMSPFFWEWYSCTQSPSPFSAQLSWRAMASVHAITGAEVGIRMTSSGLGTTCLLYTSDAADEEDSVDLG